MAIKRAASSGQVISGKRPHAEWKPVLIDEITEEILVPNGTMGQRWEEGKQWNLILEREDGSVISPALSVEPHGGIFKRFIFRSLITQAAAHLNG